MTAPEDQTPSEREVRPCLPTADAVMDVTLPTVPAIHPADPATACASITNIGWWTQVPWEDIFTRPPTIVNLPPQCTSGFTH
jgi:hypothetical protein